MYDTTKPYKNYITSRIQETHSPSHVKIYRSLLQNPYMAVDHVDGIGTKGIYHWRQRTFREAVTDALAMGYNDLARERAVPYRLQDHLLLPEDDNEAIRDVIDALVDDCKGRRVAITAGETAIHDNLEGMELSITMNGYRIIEKPNIFQPGDILIGFSSSGLHSNGFTLVRQLFQEDRAEFTIPTRIYFDSLLAVYDHPDLHGLSHITGGAYAKLKDHIPQADIHLHKDRPLKPQPIFEDIYERGVCDEKMYTTFNCGVGFVLSVSPKEADFFAAETGGQVIGEIKSGKGKVYIPSHFSRKEVII